MKFTRFIGFASKLKKRRIAVGVTSVFAVVVILLIFRMGTGAPAVATYTAERGEFLINIKTNGELKAARSATVMVPQKVRGEMRVVSLVDDGTNVEEGAFLLQFDTSDAEKRVKDQQDALDNVKAELVSLEANIESAMKQLENSLLIQGYSFEQAKLRRDMMKYEADSKKREQELEFKKSELSLDQAREKIESQKIIDESKLRKARLDIKQAEQRLTEAQEQFESMTLTAPKSGMVVLQKIWTQTGMEKIKVGSTPWRGMAVIDIPDLSTMQVKTKINEIDVSRVKLGHQTVITLDALPGPTFYGEITNIATLARQEQGTDMKVFDVEVTMDSTSTKGDLKPGMTAQCELITNKVPDVLFVPLEAVFDKEDTTVVYVKERGFNRRYVKVGAKNSDYIVIEDGLKDGDEVALRDPTLSLEEIGVEESGGNGKKSSL